MASNRFQAFAKALALEIQGACDQVACFVGHRGDIGMVREEVIRGVLRRHVPQTIGISRGYVRGEADTSSQVDVLLHDRSFPCLFNVGDLVVVSTAACRAIIEVKTMLSGERKWTDTLGGLREQGNKVRGCTARSRAPSGGAARPIVGLLVLTPPPRVKDVCRRIRASVKGACSQECPDIVCLAEDHIGVTRWSDPRDWPALPPDQFLMTKVDGLGFGLFVAELVFRLAPDEIAAVPRLWSPPGGSYRVLWKEPIERIS